MSPDVSATAPASGIAGFLTHVRLLGASVLEQVAMRVDLLSIEVQEEKARLVKLTISAALACALLIACLVMMAILVLAVYWDTPYRVVAAAALVAIFAVLAAVSGAYLAAQLRRSTALFATSAAELRRDAATLSPNQVAQA